MVYLCSRLGVIGQVETSLRSLPPAVGDLFIPVVQLAPWLLFLMSPHALVGGAAGAARARRKGGAGLADLVGVAVHVERGRLGFDAALSHILESAVEDALAREFRTYQADLLAGK